MTSLIVLNGENIDDDTSIDLIADAIDTPFIDSLRMLACVGDPFDILLFQYTS